MTKRKHTKKSIINKITKALTKTYDTINPPPKLHKCKICNKKIYSTYKLCRKCYNKYARDEERD